MILRAIYFINGTILIIFGFWISGHHVLPGFGIEETGGWQANPNLWKAVSFIGPFGAALLALGFAYFAVGSSLDARFRRVSTGYFIAGHSWLVFLVWGKQHAFWHSTGGWFLIDLVVFPPVALICGLLLERSESGASGTAQQSIREIAGQEERNRLAQDLHDSVKQQIYSIQTNLATAEARWETDPAGVREAIHHGRAGARDAMSEMTAILDRLRKDPIGGVGLVEALRRQCEAVGYQSGAEVTTYFGRLPDPEWLGSGSMTAVFRIAQESLANIARHARAAHIHVEVGLNDESNWFVLNIRDDGQGFDTQSPASGLGLNSMRARAEEIGAHLEIRSDIGEGSEVLLYLPASDPHVESYSRHLRRFVTTVSLLVPVALVTWLDIPWRSHLIPLLLFGAGIAVFHGVEFARLKWLHPRS